MRRSSTVAINDFNRNGKWMIEVGLPYLDLIEAIKRENTLWYLKYTPLVFF